MRNSWPLGARTMAWSFARWNTRREMVRKSSSRRRGISHFAQLLPSRSNGLLSPTLSSRGGEGEAWRGPLRIGGVEGDGDALSGTVKAFHAMLKPGRKNQQFAGGRRDRDS